MFVSFCLDYFGAFLFQGIAMTLDDLINYWTIFSSIVTVASAIAAVTPTKKDDAVISKLNKFISLIALNVGKASGK